MWLRMAVSKLYPTPFDPTLGAKVKYLNFVITKAVVNIFAEILQEGRAAIFMIIWDFSLNAWARSPRVYLVGGTETKMNLLSEYGYVAY